MGQDDKKERLSYNSSRPIVITFPQQHFLHTNPSESSTILLKRNNPSTLTNKK
ncbi:hypothetical protein P4523_29235 [Bacillus toyonensis]|uniref:hypothetical protein n=1 Tax=Bacillus toyonensis TaxID=155322 RepID=UPI000314C657|nr:hypothetical protein [Bacillus toyonensis]